MGRGAGDKVFSIGRSKALLPEIDEKTGLPTGDLKKGSVPRGKRKRSWFRRNKMRSSLSAFRALEEMDDEQEAEFLKNLLIMK